MTMLLCVFSLILGASGPMLERGDWIGVTLVCVGVIVVLWRAFVKQTADSKKLQEVIEQNTDTQRHVASSLRDLGASIRRTVEISEQTQARLLQAFLDKHKPHD